ncbi:MAG: hypothetical protein EOO01_05060 [Chitinophagaceae bacterium]|nr:MAG: hypothetical protein EOO01_05060 [Chitinophagaceae bacterium]
MTWIKFMLWICGVYATYYAALILTDLFKKGRSPAGSESHDLTFIEDHQPALVLAAEKPVSPIVGSGGKTLKEIFSLAREEMVEYTRGVSF